LPARAFFRWVVDMLRSACGLAGALGVAHPGAVACPPGTTGTRERREPREARKRRKRAVENEVSREERESEENERQRAKVRERREHASKANERSEQRERTKRTSGTKRTKRTKRETGTHERNAANEENERRERRVACPRSWPPVCPSPLCAGQPAGGPEHVHNPTEKRARGQPEATGNPSHEPSEARQRRRPIRPMVTAGRSLHVAGGPSGAVQRHRSDSDAPPPCTLGRWVGPSERSTIEQRRQHRGARIRRRRSGHADTTAPRMDVVGSIDARCLSAAAASVGTSGQRVQRPSRRRSTTTGASRRTSRTQHARTAVSDQVDTAGPGGQARANRRTGLPPNGGSGGPKPPGGFDVRLGYRRV